MKNNNNEKETFLEKIKNRRRLIIVIVILIAIGLFIRSRIINGKGDIEKAEVTKGEVVEELILSGQIMADEHAQLAFQTSGKLSWIGVSEGDEVEKGENLARLDSTNLSMDLKIADASLRRYASSLDKVYDDLQGKEDSETYEEIETRILAESNKDSAVYSQIKAQHNYANSVLKAPFDGIISYIANPFSGVNVLFSQTQIEVVNPETIYFEVVADQSEVTDLYVGQKVNIILDSFFEEEFEGEILFISYTPKSGEAGTVYKVKVRFNMLDFDITKLRVGMTGDASFILSEKQDVLYVPSNFVNSDKNGDYVNLKKQNNKVYIEKGLEGEERIEIMGDIKEGDIVYD